MRLNHTPPKGAGKVQHVTLTDKLLKVIDGLGNDKFGNPVGIRSPALSETSGVPAKSITALLATAVTKGRVIVCKITIPGASAQNEYRKGGGLPPPEFKPLNTKRAGVACNTPAARRAPSAEAAKGKLPPPAPPPPPAPAEPATPVLLSSTTPQPAVGNTGSAQSDSTSADERAVTSDPETPEPQPERRGMGPAPAKAPAGDVFSITLDDAGVLVIATDEGVIELQPTHAKRLGHFLVGSQGIWNPF